MNTLRTVFAFVVLVCAIAFASAAYVLVTQTEDWHDKHKKLEQTTTEQINALKDAVAKAEKEREAAVTQQGVWEKDVIRLTADLANRDIEIIKLANEKKLLDDWKQMAANELREIRGKLTEQLKDNNDLRAEVKTHLAARDAAEKAQRDAEDKQRILELDVKNLRDQLKITGVELTDSKKLNERYAAVFGEDGLRLAQAAPAPTPLISGQVKSVDNPMRLVAISVGKDDGVRVGMTFEVVRTAAKQYVGRVRVLEVKDEEAICRVDTAMTPGAIVEGDHVTTRVQ